MFWPFRKRKQNVEKPFANAWRESPEEKAKRDAEMEALLASNRAAIEREEALEKKHSRRTPLHDAAQNGNESVIQQLLQNGLDVNAKDDDRTGYGMNPLEYAAAAGHTGVVKLLLQNGATVEGRNEDRSPLHRACRRGRVEVVRVLLEHGAKPDGGRPLEAWSALHETCAAEFSSEPLEIADQRQRSIAEMLLNAGAAANSKGPLGATPLHEAANRGYVAVATALLSHGADLNAKLEDGQTPLDRAPFNSRMEKFFRERGAKGKR